MPNQHVLGLLSNEQTAEGLVRALQTRISREDISLIHRASELHLSDNVDTHPPEHAGERTIIGTGIGAALGLTFIASNLTAVGASAALAGFGPLAALIYGGMFGGTVETDHDSDAKSTDVHDLLKQVERGKLLVHAVADSTMSSDMIQLFRNYGCKDITVVTEK